MRLYEIIEEDGCPGPDDASDCTLLNPLYSKSVDFGKFYDVMDEVEKVFFGRARKIGDNRKFSELNRAFLDSLPVENIPVKDIVYMERCVNPDRVKSPSKKPILVVELNGKYLAMDGNHRALNAAMGKLATIPAAVIRRESTPKSTDK